ncbi:Palmitoyltransferase pfa4 protein [Rutstroemia sp. NJR-2017a BBW]|nr:Palmitoyltransferase pfa4 protein [Rutstroemia sp. NJR-2017a BBW]
MAHLSRYRITSIQDLAQPFCYLHMSFLSYASQILFYYIEPGPLRHAMLIRGGRAGPMDGPPLSMDEQLRLAHYLPALYTFLVLLGAVINDPNVIPLHSYCKHRDLPAYLGPSKTSLAFLLIITCSNGLSLFAMTILFLRTCYSLSINTTMIESWEIEKHAATIERSRRMGGYVYANGGSRVYVKKVEFPYDVDIWTNIVQGMGTANPVAWFWPFSRGPSVEGAVEWEENGFNDKEGEWPPLDPDKLGRRIDRAEIAPGCAPQMVYESVDDEREAFKRRQEMDLKRRQNVMRDENTYSDNGSREEDGYGSEYEEGLDGEGGWTNSEGDRLKDFGVDEDADALDEDDIPLGELLRRRKAKSHVE